MRHISRTVWVLSLVSLFTDMASELLYPVMPIYLKTVGFSVFLIGILEGVAEATAGLSKGYFGQLSDVSGKRVPFVKIGYTLSAISKPLLAVSAYPAWIFMLRTIERFGKGIRTGARDAILSDEANGQSKGRVFGIHRAMDTLGAAIGPFIALLYLQYHPGEYRNLFIIAIFPGVLSIVSSFLLKEKPEQNRETVNRVSPLGFLKYIRRSPTAYRRIMIGLLAFTLFNSSDVFLLLRARELGLNDTQVIATYIFYNLVYALFAYPAGILADRIGLKPVFIGGLLVFSIVYFGMSASKGYGMVIVVFFLYGLYAAATEGISKAWISEVVDQKDVATALGTFAGMQSMCALLASSLAGFLWYRHGATVAFGVSALMAALVSLYFLLKIPPPSIRQSERQLAG